MSDMTIHGVAFTSPSQTGVRTDAGSAARPAERLPSPTERTEQKIESAVYGYVKATRALGRENVSISEIATALAVPQGTIVSALAALRARGIWIPTI